MFAFSLRKTLRREGQRDYSTLVPTELQFSKSDELYLYIVMPTVTMKCLPADVHLSNLQNGSINEPNGTWAIPHLSETASAISRIAMQTFMAALHSEETTRTNCSRVQQSRPGTIIYEPNHLWVPYMQGQSTDCLHANSQRSNTRVLNKLRNKKIVFPLLTYPEMFPYAQSNQ